MPTIFNKDNDLIYIYWTDLRWYDISIRFVLKLITHVLNMQWYFVPFFSCTKGVKVTIHLYEPKEYSICWWNLGEICCYDLPLTIIPLWFLANRTCLLSYYKWRFFTLHIVVIKRLTKRFESLKVCGLWVILSLQPKYILILKSARSLLLLAKF